MNILSTSFLTPLKKYIYLTVVSVLGTVLPLVSFLYLAWRISFYLNAGSTWFQKLLYSLLILLVGNALFYEIFNLSNMRPDIHIIGLLYSLIGAVLTLGYKPNRERAYALLSKGDAVALTAAFMSFIFLLFPVYYNSRSGTYAGSTLHMLTNGEDNASHFALYKYAYTHDGYAYSTQVGNKGLISTLTDYPQGSEFTSAWLVKSILGNKISLNNTRLVEAYYLSFCAIFSVVVLLICMVSLELYENKKNRLSFLQASGLIAMASIMITIGPLLSLVARGFLSQIFAFIFLLGLILALFEYRRNKYSQGLFIFALLMCAGVTISWWFISPLAIMLIVVAYYREVQIRNARNILIVSAIFVSSIYPIVLGELFSAGSGYLTQEGGIDKPSILMTAFFFLGSLAVLKGRSPKKSCLIIILLGGWLFFTLFVGAYQIAAVGHLSYYFYKSVYTVFVLGSIGLLYSILLLFKRINSPKRTRTDFVFGCLTLLVTILGFLIWKPVYPRVYAHDWFNNLVTPSSMGTLLHDSSTNSFKDYLFVGGCNAPARYISNRWSGALMLSEEKVRSKFDLDSLIGSKSNQLASLKRLNKTGVYIYASRACMDKQTLDYISALDPTTYTFVP